MNLLLAALDGVPGTDVDRPSHLPVSRIAKHHHIVTGQCVSYALYTKTAIAPCNNHIIDRQSNQNEALIVLPNTPILHLDNIVMCFGYERTLLHDY